MRTLFRLARSLILGLVKSMRTFRLWGFLLLSICVTATAASRPTLEQLKSWAIYTPRPSFFTVETTQFVPGPGVFLLRFDAKSGTVSSVEIIKSTMYGEIDRSCVKIFKQWKFKPGVLPKDFELKIPLDSKKVQIPYH